MSDFTEFREEVDRGQRGESIFLPLAGAKLGKLVSVAKSMYFLFGGMPGSGKTAIVDSVLLLDLYDWWMENKQLTLVEPFWIYRSMERARKFKIAKWTCYKLHKDHKLLIDVPTLLNWPTKLFDLTPEIIALIDAYEPYFEELFKHVQIVDGPMNPTGIFKHLENFMLTQGEVVQVNEHRKKYVPKYPNRIYLHIVDHVGKITAEKIHGTQQVMNDKQTLDKHSEYMGYARDFYQVTPIDIAQLNREIEDTMRNLKTELTVQPKDFKGSGNMYENADVVFGLMNPYKLQDFDHMGYDIKEFVTPQGFNTFRSLKVIKNSWGIDDFQLGYYFLGQNGRMSELPKSDQILYDLYK